MLAHDAVYWPGRRDNEARSASLARHWIDVHGLSARLETERVVELIELTASHGRLTPRSLPSHDAALVLDIDMSILAAPWSDYVEYERGVAAEYVPEVGALAFRWGRRRWLRRTLARRWIFLSPHYHGQLDARARHNMARWLELDPPLTEALGA